MSAVQDTAWELRAESRGGSSWPWSGPGRLLDEGLPLIGYVTGVIACYLAAFGWAAARTPVAAGDFSLFTALMCCGAACVEASGRLGQPTGAWRDLLSAWWMPVTLLLPPLYALAAPFVLGLLGYLRVSRGAIYRRAFSGAALGLSGALTSSLFRWLLPRAPGTEGIAWLSYPGPNAWLLRPQQAAAAIGCAVVFGLLNAGLVAVAVWLADPEVRLADMLRDRERTLLDLTEACVGILVTLACALSSLLLLVALPPVLLLQRSLLHAQLKAQARTDAKTGVLNAGAWQGEAVVAVDRARRRRAGLAVLLTDVDYFKRVNDAHGHLTGDAVLRTLAAEMRRQVRDTDLVGRFGGEEFAILLNGTTAAEACLVAERIRCGVGVIRVPAKDVAVGVTVSIGVAVIGAHGTDLHDLLEAADRALYQAKDDGRDRVRLAGPPGAG
jgi:diguanylate cyclase (GGDEF)-like protein